MPRLPRSNVCTSAQRYDETNRFRGTISLLPNVLAKQEAHIKNASEAWLFNKEGYITEGCASNACSPLAPNPLSFVFLLFSQQLLKRFHSFALKPTMCPPFQEISPEQRTYRDLAAPTHGGAPLSRLVLYGTHIYYPKQINWIFMTLDCV